MNWYIAKIVFQINSMGASKCQFDEHLRLISADTFEEALLKAKAVGIQEEEFFFNDRNQPVKWEFVNISELFPVQIGHGSEIYSHIFETEEASDYIQQIHRKAAAMQLEEFAKKA